MKRALSVMVFILVCSMVFAVTASAEPAVYASYKDQNGSWSAWQGNFSHWSNVECTTETLEQIQDLIDAGYGTHGNCVVLGRMEASWASAFPAQGVQIAFNNGTDLGRIGVNWTSSYWDLEQGRWRDWKAGTAPKSNALDQAWNSGAWTFAKEWEDMDGQNWKWTGTAGMGAPMVRFVWVTSAGQINIREIWRSVRADDICADYPISDNNFEEGSIARNYFFWDHDGRASAMRDQLRQISSAPTARGRGITRGKPRLRART